MPLLTLRRLCFPRCVKRVLVLLSVLTALAVNAGQAAVQHTKIDREIFHPSVSFHSDDHTWPPRESGSEFPVEDLRQIREKLTGDLTPRERTILLRRAASLNLDLGNFSQAIENVEASLATGALTKLEIEENYSFLGRLYLAAEPPNIEKSIENLRRYIELRKKPSVEAHFYLGQDLAMLDRFEEAIPHAQKAIELSKAPDEYYYRVLLYCHLRLKQYDLSVPLIERMLTMFPPKDEIFEELAIGYQELGRPRHAFLVHAMRYELGFLTSETDLVKLADLYSAHGNPYRGARLLDKEMKAGRVKKTAMNYFRLGDMWLLTREYELAREAYIRPVLGSMPGEYDVRIGLTYFFEDKWGGARRHFRRALNKGGIEKPCQVRMLLGHTLNNMGNLEAAKEQYKRAARAESCPQYSDQAQRHQEEPGAFRNQQHVDEWLRLARSQDEIDVIRTWEIACQKSAFLVADDERVRVVAGDALNAVKAARSAETVPIRRRYQFDYEWARENVLRRPNLESLKAARRALAASKEMPKILKGRKPDDLRILRTCKVLFNRRISALERAQRILHKAERVAGSIMTKH